MHNARDIVHSGIASLANDLTPLCIDQEITDGVDAGVARRTVATVPYEHASKFFPLRSTCDGLYGQVVCYMQSSLEFLLPSIGPCPYTIDKSSLPSRFVTTKLSSSRRCCVRVGRLEHECCFASQSRTPRSIRPQMLSTAIHQTLWRLRAVVSGFRIMQIRVGR